MIGIAKESFSPRYWDNTDTDYQAQSFWVNVLGKTDDELKASLVAYGPTNTTDVTLDTTAPPVSYAPAFNINEAVVYAAGDAPPVGANLIFNGVNAGNIAQLINNGGIAMPDLNYLGELRQSNLPKPAAPKPTIAILETYKIISYLGNYGAGQTVKTFSLLPGEKTTITVKSYKSSVETRKRAESMVDSVSSDSVKEFDKLFGNREK